MEIFNHEPEQYLCAKVRLGARSHAKGRCGKATVLGHKCGSSPMIQACRHGALARFEATKEELE
jgi:hypothetical protein